jgi:serine/threonine protein kinase
MTSLQFESFSSSFTTSPPLPAELYYRDTIDCLLGEGAASQVYRAFDSNANRFIAIKRIDLLSPINSSQQIQRAQSILLTALTELKVYQRLHTQGDPLPFITQLHSAYVLPSFSTCYLIMSCLKTDLRRVLKITAASDCTFSESSVVYIVGCISSALNFLHHRRIIHRDVKPDNICLDSFGRPYLTDFGISCLSSTANPLPISHSTSGTLPYISPEALAPLNCHSYQSDFWSLGVTAYELFFRHLPFPRLCPLEMVKFVANSFHWLWRELLSETSETPKPLPPIDSIDFTAIQDSNPSAERPFPEFNLTLNEDGSLPQLLLPLFPETTRAAAEASELFKSLLCGLLDVRIPYRLGSLTQFKELSEHPIFVWHGLTPFSALSSMASPFATAEFLNRPGATSPQDLKITVPVQLDRGALKELLTPEMKHLLCQFQYPSLSVAPASASARDLLPRI